MQLATSFDDIGVVPARRSWAALRSLRAVPAGRASGSGRRPTFVAALEQAEQLFTAAARVGVATKPILVFYGLSQAGRAVAAAQVPDNSWQLSGHGLRTSSEQTRDRPLAELTVSPDGGGSFAAIGQILMSSMGQDAVSLGDLWPLVARPDRHALPGAGSLHPLSIHVDGAAWSQGNPTVRVGEIPVGAVGVQGARPDIGFYGSTYAEQAEAVGALLARYPTLAHRRAISYQGLPLGLQDDHDGTCSVIFQWPEEVVGQYSSPEEFCGSIAVEARGEWLAFPTVGGCRLPVHPLLAWWAILFRLSMLARYEPSTWERMTNVNTSTDAVPIENLLDAALSTVPELLVHQFLRGSDRA